MSSIRHFLTAVLVLLAAGGLVLGLTARRVDDELLSSPSVARAARAALGVPAARDALADVLTRRLIERLPEPARAGEGLLRDAMGRAVGTDVFEDVFAAAVEDTHASLLDHPGGPVVLDLSGTTEVVKDEIGEVSSVAAALVPADLLSSFEVGTSRDLPDLRRAEDLVDAAATWGLVTALLAFAAALVVSPSPWGVVAATGLFVAAGSGVVWILLSAGPGVALTGLDGDLRVLVEEIAAQATDGVRGQAATVAVVAAGAAVAGLVMALRPRPARLV